MAARSRISLAPLLGMNSRRVADRTLGGTFMRGGFNFELRDGEWWTRAGEQDLGGSKRRYGSCPWWWIMDINRDLTIIANPWWALALLSSGNVTELYTAAVTENVAFTNGSATATSSTTRVVDQLILVDPFSVGETAEVYRVKARTGSTMTLDRPYEGTTGASKSCRFIDPLARDTTGTAVAYSASSVVAGQIQGSCVVFEQLVTHAVTDLYAHAPALTGGNLHLVITSNIGIPVAIDLSAYLAGSTVDVRRRWFYNTALGSSAAVVGTDDVVDTMTPRGVFAEVYKGRLFIGAAADPSGEYGTRTAWWSQQGDLGRWHTGIAGQTAAPNFKTFDGEGNAIAEMKVLQDDLIVHRQDSQEIASITQSLATPFSFRSNNQGIGVRAYFQTNAVVVANGAHFIWTPQGPAVFDGRSVTLIAEDARDALAAFGFIHSPAPINHVAHDAVRRRIYWFGRNARRHQDALPATATVTLLSGEMITNYTSCFVFDYANGSSWMEDRPTSLGNGNFTDSTTEGSVLHLSRPDGTIVKLLAESSNAMDADILAPNTSGSDYAVYAQVETPWLDFGNLLAKRLIEVEVQFRNPTVGGDIYDDGVSFSGTPWLRLRVFSDTDRSAQRAGIGCVYSLSDTRLTTSVDYRQSALGVMIFSPDVKSHGRAFKLVLSNDLTSAANSAGYKTGPVRISDIQCAIAQHESDIPITANGTASLAE